MLTGAVLALLASTGRPNIADEILSLDSRIKSVTPAMRVLLDNVIDEAAKDIRKLPTRQGAGFDGAYASSVFLAIDKVMVRNGFVYPARGLPESPKGLVDQLADSLVPHAMNDAAYDQLKATRHNERRLDEIERRHLSGGSYYVTDCDTASFVYLGVADKMNLPVFLIDLPGYDTQAGHNFVRWQQSGGFLDWETMDGRPESDRYYRTTWRITPAQESLRTALVSLSRQETLGYAHATVAQGFEKRHDFAAAIKENLLALKLYPQSTLAANNYAWENAVAPKLVHRDNAGAIRYALYAVNVSADPNEEDTLAAAYASAGLYELAVRVEEQVVKSGGNPDYASHLALFRSHRPFRDTGG